jgi:signal peptidase I
MARASSKQEYGAEKKKKLPARVFFGMIAVLAILALSLFALSPFLLDQVKAESGAMSPAIGITDTVGVNHFSYLLFPPARGDIILFRTSRGESGASSRSQSASLRRIIGLPGETVQIMDGTVYINGYPLEEPYRSGEMTYGGTAASALTLSSDEYFVMADNRSNNFDSRDSTVGPVSGSEIIGKAWIRLKPYEHFGLVS